MQRIESWGRYPGAVQKAQPIWWRDDRLPDRGSVLPFGAGRSYGDSCLNPAGRVITTRALDRFLQFDPTLGIVRCEVGVTLGEVLDRVVPSGWLLPVLPGTQFATVGGAIANDVHGKNHHVAGTFGVHTRALELLRSDGTRMRCSADENRDWYSATIGGLGLTGLITWAELQLVRIQSAMVECETVRFDSLKSFQDLSEEADRTFEFTVAWFDCYSWRDGSLRGIFSRARHVHEDDGTLAGPRLRPRASLPIVLPNWCLGSRSMRAFNAGYYASKHRHARQCVRFESFLFPLDAVANWNRAYGSRGFLQLQCALPELDRGQCVAALLEMISRSGQGSFLAVLKSFGRRVSPGYLSFPMPGLTLALDFQNKGQDTIALLRQCHRIIATGGGRVYPAKDACMSPEVFATGFPEWRRIIPFLDPAFSSGFWQRTAGTLMT